jgi:nicotinamide mononucleotide adenylyltransferase
MRGSFASWRSGRSSAQGATTYEQPQARDSRADMMQDILKANEAEADRIDMVNVRACCDGKHDVGDLHHHHSAKSRHGSYNKTRRSLAGSMSSRSHSRAESSRGRDDQIRHQTELEAANSGAY